MKKLEGKRVVLAVAHEFEDVELLYPLLRLSEEGASVVVATLSQDRHFHTRPYFREKPVTGRFGTTVPVVVLKEGRRYTHRFLDDLQISELDALVFPGGFSPDYLRIDAKTLELTAQAYRAGKLIAAICHGPQILISVDRQHGTNLVRGRKVTAFQAVRDDLLNAGAEYLDVPAMRSDNVITGRVPDDLPEFCQEIIRYLAD
ncbi:MAG: type 1 glutamine amidotransferase [Acidobacteria bacterium]|nr:type 1 glutamine amidotransferase [Acidobacteriota bacterium]MCI0721727.1 type 1 glutamine amidotransferase [Acidobacteriota bacterium]